MTDCLNNKDFEMLTTNELLTVYYNFCAYRHKLCSGMAEMSINDFYKKYGMSEYPGDKK